MSMRPVALCALALVYVSLFQTVVLAENDYQLECEKNARICSLRFTVEDGEEYSFPLSLVGERSLFTESLTVKRGDEFFSFLTAGKGNTYHAAEGNGVATIQVNENGENELVHGVFSTERHGTVEFGRKDADGSSLRGSNLHRRRLWNTNGRGAPWVDPILFADPKNPGSCFPGDDKVHVARFSVIVDAGFVSQAVGTETDPDKQVSLVVAAVEDILSLARMVWAVQLNIRLEVNFLEIGSSSSQAPLSWSPATGCGSATDAYNRLLRYVSERPSDNWAGMAFLISRCFTGTDFGGVALPNSFCLNGKEGVGLSFANPVTIAHELGHLFGSSHSLEDGQGTTGGIMDVGGSGVFLGSQQFHPGRKDEVCRAITGVKTTRDCKFFIEVSNNTCGDGILAPEEECECLPGVDGSAVTSCGECQMCQIINDETECSTTYAIRQASDRGYVRVQPSLLASPSCCVDGKIAIATTCNSGRDMCTNGGFCTPVCSTLGYASCGSGATGCRQKCVVFGQCVEVSTRLVSRNVTLNAVPAGTDCFVTPGTSDTGKCFNGACLAVADDSDPGSTLTNAPTNAELPIQATNSPTASITQSPTPRTDSPTQATLSPTVVTGSPTFSIPDDDSAPTTIEPPLDLTDSPTTPPPTLSPTRPSICPTIRKKGPCRRQMTCVWSRNRCSPVIRRPARGGR